MFGMIPSRAFYRKNHAWQVAESWQDLILSRETANCGPNIDNQKRAPAKV